MSDLMLCKFLHILIKLLTTLLMKTTQQLIRVYSNAQQKLIDKFLVSLREGGFLGKFVSGLAIAVPILLLIPMDPVVEIDQVIENSIPFSVIDSMEKSGDTEQIEMISEVAILDLKNFEEKKKQRTSIIQRVISPKAPVKPVSVLRQLKPTFERYDVGRTLPRAKSELIAWMRARNYTGDLESMGENHLRRCVLAYEYDALWWGVHEKTGIPIAVVFGYFIVESIRSKPLHQSGWETDLFAIYGNPGGVKASKGEKGAKFFDDCWARGVKVKCTFAIYETPSQTIDAWSTVFNRSRYNPAKSGKTAGQICLALQNGGYHTANNWKARAKVANDYWEYRNHFPVK